MERHDSTADAEQPLGDAAAPRPTYAPVTMAMGVSMTLWGMMAVSLNIHALWIMSLVGLGLVVWALQSWIREIVVQWEASP